MMMKVGGGQLICCSSICSTGSAFNPSPSCHHKIPSRHNKKRRSSTSHQTQLNHRHNCLLFMIPPQVDDTSDQVLAAWMFAFASSHIGMSATRSSIIQSLGETANSLNLVGNEEWVLPTWWPGDNNGNKIFPDNLTVGRQIYRVLYTAVSFITLGSAFGAYLHSSSFSLDHSGAQSALVYNACLLSAALSFGASIASLVNASPLGLMPSFEADGTSDNSGSVVGIRRDDALKFTTRGLTRITRHPLILPVVPWGIATAILAGGRPCDAILFGGLSIYAMAGCYAQDLRVIREEGSVGTVFQTESRNVNEGASEEEQEGTRLRAFFEQTSFVPFKAVFDGRQSLDDIVREFPWLQFFVGTIVGMYLEEKILQLLADWSV